ncbi:uncharacterized protein LOC115996030 [Ipomoea triloba]|uniref:uncharacterized protein LOC115996030 n=1 Tax=Ipomoea triloba TaxID=35885 RepID=UPI00125CDD3A|nr:uncharacterized protein LOC115996030 [Ipomoea triloba]
MSTISWNCRGLGNPRTVREVVGLVFSKKPDFLFLMETKVARSQAESLRVKLGFEGLFYVDRAGFGGLALFWRKNCTASLLGYYKNHVDVKVSVASSPCWRMTCYYGFPERNRRREAWDFLRSLAFPTDMPWVVLGDFNDLLFHHEKRRGNPHPDALLRGFGEAVDDCNLFQLPLKGYQYTWERGKGTENWMKERLDKVLVNESWNTLQDGAYVENILTRSSDHSAMFLCVNDGIRRRGVGRRDFKFEMAWLHDEGCRNVVENAWHDGRLEWLLPCLRLCGERGLHDPASLAEFKRIEDQLPRLEAQEDTFWRQRAKQHWLRGADANTKFYHRYASARKKKNTLSKLKNDEGVWVEGDAMQSVILNYFNDIFHSSGSSLVESFFNGITPRVSQTDNNYLLRPFENEEVKEALFSMFPDKAPGPDGMNPGFYQHYWDVVGGDVTSFVLDCLNSGSFPEGLNATNVVLIPKKSVPQTVSDLRPIALCNVVYKIMAKLLANRMKPLLGNLISESQSAFIPGRLITDNILVAAEVGHFLNRKQCGVAGWGALKLDMANAYDRMEWPFLKRMLEALGFAEGWINLIMLCVTTVSYDFLVNGTLSGQVVPTRGLRQGDPLSPYLFIICAEGLSLLLQKAQADGSIRGCRVARGAPSVSHLFFADDSLLFFRSNAQEAGAIKHCLSLYESMSGQVVNYHKSSVCFSRNTMVEHREEVVAVLGVVQAPNFGKYLGLPAFVGRNKKAALSYIEDKIKQRMGSWNKKLLSQAGKEVLLKTIAQAMPTFSMSVFLLPESVCLSIERTMNRFWWGSGNDKRIHWKAWDKLCVPNRFGGLGFKDLRAFNLAMLGKQAWRFLTTPQSLVAKIYKARYFPRTSFIDATVGNCPSFCWRSIMAAHGLICNGVRRRIGDGKSTLIWGHPWLPDDPSPMIYSVMPEQLNGLLVSGLVDTVSGECDVAILNDIFTQEDVSRILRVPLSPSYEDSWYWFGDPIGTYSVKNGYKTITGEFGDTPGTFNKWATLWKIKIPPKWKMFLWRALSDTLPVASNLVIKRVEIDPTCSMCGLAHEDVMHAFVLCDFSKLVWHESTLILPPVMGDSFCTWFTRALRDQHEDNIALLVAVMYDTWQARNKAVWDGYLPRPRSVTAAATRALHAWREVHGVHVMSSVSPSRTPSPVLSTEVLAPLKRCYIDASYIPATKKASFGAVMLSSAGDFVAVCAGPLPSCFSPFMAEILGCREALSWLRGMNVSAITLHTDCSQLKKHIMSPTTVFSYAGIALEACRAAMALFAKCDVILVPRLSNALAHTLAASATLQISTMHWNSIPPDSISALLN